MCTRQSPISTTAPGYRHANVQEHICNREQEPSRGFYLHLPTWNAWQPQGWTCDVTGSSVLRVERTRSSGSAYSMSMPDLALRRHHSASAVASSWNRHSTAAALGTSSVPSPPTTSSIASNDDDTNQEPGQLDHRPGVDAAVGSRVLLLAG